MASGRKKRRIAGENIPIVSLSEKKQNIAKSFYGSLIFSERMDLDEWADLYRKLPQETSSEYGTWNTDRFPFLRRIMKCLSPSSKAKMIVVMKGSQLGFTELAITWMLYCADHNPGPMVYCQKTEAACKKFSEQKLKPNINANDKVLYTLGKMKPKSLANSWHNKAYPGGFISLVPANSPEGLKSVSARDCITDEEDSYELSIGHDGSPPAMLAKRQTNFPDKKLYRPSTPQLTETSTIEPAFKTGTEERYYLPCPHCNPNANEDGFMFYLTWKNIKYSKELDKTTGYPIDVWCECPNCLGRIEETQKTWMLANGDWYTEKNNNGKRYKIEEDPDIVSFQIPSFYSPYGFFSWSEAVEDWFKYKVNNDKALLQVFVNQTCAETFTLTGSDMSFGKLYGRRERYNKNNIDVPSMGLVLTAGVDIQKDRIEAETRAWGMYDETWGVDYSVFMGDTAQLGNDKGYLNDGQPSVWLLLDEYLKRLWQHESGIALSVESCMIDAQYRTEEVNIFCKGKESRRIFPVHGKSGWGRDFFVFSKKRHERYGTLNCTAYVDMLKHKVRSMLKNDTYGPGFCHWPQKDCYSEEYFAGLTCEVLATKMVKGSPVLYWDNPTQARNEPTDLFNWSSCTI